MGDTICIGEINGVVCQYDQKATSMPPPDSTVRGERSFAIKSCRARRRVMDAAMSEAGGTKAHTYTCSFRDFCPIPCLNSGVQATVGLLLREVRTVIRFLRFQIRFEEGRKAKFYSWL